MPSGRAALVMLAVGVAGLGSNDASSARRPAPFLAAGDLTQNTVVVRAAPSKRAPAVRVLDEFRMDFRLQIVLAVAQAKGPHGGRWVELSLPGRPNGGRGWVPKAAVELHHCLLAAGKPSPLGSKQRAVLLDGPGGTRFSRAARAAATPSRAPPATRPRWAPTGA